MFLEALDERWPKSPEAELAGRILPEYLQLGPPHFIRNADVKLLVWRAGDQVLPVVYRERASMGHTANVCSPWIHYVRYPLGEIDRHGEGIGALLARGTLWASMPLLKMSRIDDVVWVNNWLLASNPAVALERPEVERLTAALCERFPRRAIVFRSVNPEIGKDLAADLAACGYRMVASRTVYLLDPASREYRESENVRRDRKLLYDGEYEIVSHEELSAEDMPRLVELHRLLYIEKHSPLNPEFTLEFYETAWRNRFLEFRGLRKKGRLDVYVAYHTLGGMFSACLLGYDTRLPEKVGLYRRAVALLMEETRRLGLRMHLSAGAGEFKHHRGARPCIEYDAVFDRHLPLSRRAGWKLLEAAGVIQDRKVRRGW